MDAFQGQRRAAQPSYTQRGLAGFTGPTQTPVEANVQQAAQPAVRSGVNPSLLGGLGAFQPAQPVAVPVPVQDPRPAQVAPVFRAQPQQQTQPQIAPQPAQIQPQPLAATQFSTQPAAQQTPYSQTNTPDFSIPRPQTIAQPSNQQIVARDPEAIRAEVAMDEAADRPVQHHSPFDIALIEEIEKPKNRLSAGRAWRKWLLTGGIAMFCALLGTGGVLFAQGMGKAHSVFRGTAAKTSSDKPQLLDGESDGRVNILLLGNGGDGHEAPDLTDTLVVASIDTVNKNVMLLSVPRDLWVQVPEYGEMKINAAYEVGKYNKLHKIDSSNADTAAVEAGFAQADQAIETVLGLKIHYNMLGNFSAFKQAVDAVGGVDINVPEQLYDPTMAWENGNNPVLAKAGQQQMNGVQALMYARSRETSSDFARGERQRALLVALKSKALSAGTLSNPLKISQLLSAFGDNMVSDLSLSEAMRAYSLTKGISDTNIKSIDLVTPPNALITTGTIQNVSIDKPKAGMFQYADIQAYIKQLTTVAQAAPAATNKSTTAPTDTPADSVITVLNGTTKAGLAGTKAGVLKAAGYTVGTVGNAPAQTYAKTVVVDLSGGANGNARKYLEGLYGVTAVTSVPDPAIQAGSAKFIVILGSDQAL